MKLFVVAVPGSRRYSVNAFGLNGIIRCVRSHEITMFVSKEGAGGVTGMYVGISVFGLKFNNISRGPFGVSAL